MAIKRTKNKEEMPDFDEIMTEVEQEVETQKTEQEITNHLSELKELYGKLDEATRALTTANQELQSALHIYQQVEKNLCSKIDSINQHVDNVLDTAPDRLNVEIKIIDIRLCEHDHPPRYSSIPIKANRLKLGLSLKISRLIINVVILTRPTTKEYHS